MEHQPPESSMIHLSTFVSMTFFADGCNHGRVPDELKRHSLTDKGGSQYSTNLDRNRYGTDNQYLSTVIRYDLDYLNLCPCLIDVEIIDAKNGNGTVVVSAGDHACSCTSQPGPTVRPCFFALGLLPLVAWPCTPVLC